MIFKPNYIILGSTGRNTGKTEFACRLIEQYSKNHSIVGVKVVAIDPNEGNCPRGGKGCGVCTSLEGKYQITEETELDPSKDTSRMLLAGAGKVYFLKVDIHNLADGLAALAERIPNNALAVCESNSIRKVLEPGLFLVIKNLRETKTKDSCAEVIHLADKIIDFDNMSWNFQPRRVQIKNNQWIIKNEATAIVLAGGKSSRMQGEDKSMLPVDGKPLIQHIVEQLEGHFDEIIIGANDPEKYQFLGKRIIPDVEKDKGPLMGIYSCLKASNSEINFVTACDIPQMNLKLIRQMIESTKTADIVMPVKSENEHEPMFAVYKKIVADSAKKILDNDGRRIIELFKYHKPEFIELNNAGWYKNLNRKEDYVEYIDKEKVRKCNRCNPEL